MEWIKFSDRLPELQKNILVIYEDNIYTAQYLYYEQDKPFYSLNIKSDGCGCCAGDDKIGTNIFYWSEMPQLPKE